MYVFIMCFKVLLWLFSLTDFHSVVFERLTVISVTFIHVYSVTIQKANIGKIIKKKSVFFFIGWRNSVKFNWVSKWVRCKIPPLAIWLEIKKIYKKWISISSHYQNNYFNGIDKNGEVKWINVYFTTQSFFFLFWFSFFYRSAEKLSDIFFSHHNVIIFSRCTKNVE